LNSEALGLPVNRESEARPMVPHVGSARAVRTAPVRARSLALMCLPQSGRALGGEWEKARPRRCTNEPTLSQRIERVRWVRFSGKRQESTGKDQKFERDAGKSAGSRNARGPRSRPRTSRIF